MTIALFPGSRTSESETEGDIYNYIEEAGAIEADNDSRSRDSAVCGVC